LRLCLHILLPLGVSRPVPDRRRKFNSLLTIADFARKRPFTAKPAKKRNASRDKIPMGYDRMRRDIKRTEADQTKAAATQAAKRGLTVTGFPSEPPQALAAAIEAVTLSCCFSWGSKQRDHANSGPA